MPEETKIQWDIPREKVMEVYQWIQNYAKRHPSMKQERVARKAAVHFKLKVKDSAKVVQMNN